MKTKTKTMMKTMNTTTKMSNSLQRIFDFQKAFQSELHGIELPALNNAVIGEYALGVFTELGEALAVNKNWKKWRCQSEFDEQAFREEIADIWLFLVNITLASNMDAEDILAEIERKQTIIKQRIKEDYYEKGQKNSL